MVRMACIAAVAQLAILAAPVAPPLEAQEADDHPIEGVWRLNLDKSSFEPGSGPRGLMRRFGIDDEGYLVSVRITVQGNGIPTFAMARARLDGGDYPVWTDGAVYGYLSEGAEPGGTASFKAVDDRTLELTQKNAEGEINPLSPNTWEVSSDGSTLTVTTTGTNADGEAVHNVEVFDRVEIETGG
ncbi:MAG: hypothetical protein OEO23_15515 [Gemmatimonadota bacterium]|nr:hypothetical protein [Gemmatimonadota bacterium]